MFHEWPLAIARRLSEDQSTTEFMGLVSGKERVCRRVEGQKNPPITPLYRLYALEKEWLPLLQKTFIDCKCFHVSEMDVTCQTNTC